MFFFAFILGVLSLAATVYLRVGSPRSRWWERTDGIIDETFAFLFLPALSALLLGLVLVGAGMLSGSLPALRIIFFILGGASALIGLIGSLMGLFNAQTPRWLLPKWRINSPYRKKNK
ncbi:hypothetical protein [Gleimia hominis]|uniref:hypothetical protein n=1 Tax=Gleimia hominis TaxID=595468 RepID=UPI000C8100F9|nr:hypothetical protein [Gleimia hominis]WIK64527.1 hypothetical protein CJ187_000190 [Gleimia hominis]